MFTLPELPFSPDAFPGLISEKTFSFHHGKHHNAYVNNLNNLLKGNADYEGKSLEEVIKLSKSGPVFNNAAQHYNHSFFWKSLTPKNGGFRESGPLYDQIVKDFKSFDEFKTKFSTVAATHFGSGWAWIVLTKDKKIDVVGTHDAETPITQDLVPLLTIDVWEHAYYLDYQNLRPKFVEDFVSKMANWDFAEENYLKNL